MRPNPNRPATTVDENVVLMELVEKTDDAGLVRELLAYGAQRLPTPPSQLRRGPGNAR